MEKKLEYGGFIEVTMEDMKEIHHAPTVDEVVEAFGCCQSKEKKCKECPFHEFGSGCLDVIITDTLDLINLQKAEIERLTGEINQRREMMSRMDCNYATEIQKNAELQKQVDKAWLEVGKMCMEERTNTAKEILQIIKAYDEEDYLQDLENVIAKRYGVEVE